MRLDVVGTADSTRGDVCRAELQRGPSDGIFTAATLRAQPGVEYTVHADSDAPPGAKLRVQLEWFDGSDRPIEASAIHGTGRDGWQEVRTTARAPDDARSVRVSIYANESNGVLLVSDVTLRRVQRHSALAYVAANAGCVIAFLGLLSLVGLVSRRILAYGATGAAAGAILLAFVVAGHLVVPSQLKDADDIVRGFAGLIALVVVGTAVFRPVIGLAALTALIPFQYRLSFAEMEIGTNEIALFGVALAVLPRLRLPSVPGWVLIGAGFLSAGYLTAVIFASDRQEALFGAARWCAAFILLFAAFSIAGRDQAVRRKLAVLITVPTAVAVLLGFLQYSGYTVLTGLPFSPGRIDGTFGYYTLLAGYCAVAGVVGLAEVVSSTANREYRIAGAFATTVVIAGAGVVLSESRGGALAFAAGGIVVCLLSIRVGRRGFVAVAVTVAALAVVVAPTNSFSTVRERVLDPSTSAVSDEQRRELQRLGFRAARAHPEGIGYGNFPTYWKTSYVPRQPEEPLLDQPFFHAHNLVIQIAVDGGALALVGFLLLIGSALVVSIAALWADGSSGLGTLGIAAALVGLLAQGIGDYVLHETVMVVLIVVLLYGAWLTQQSGKGTGPTSETSTSPSPVDPTQSTR